MNIGKTGGPEFAFQHTRRRKTEHGTRLGRHLGTATSQTLQAILEEIRNLRQDLQNSTGAARRTEIFLYRKQTQETVVARAFQSVARA